MCPISEDGRKRVIVEGVTPQIDGGRYPVKRVVGDTVVVEADVFADGHDLPAALLRWRPDGAGAWLEAPMEPLGNDRWRASFEVTQLGRYRYTVMGWIDRFHTWQHDFRKRVEARQDVSIDLRIGAGLVAEVAGAARGADGEKLHAWAEMLDRGPDLERRVAVALSAELAELMGRNDPRRCATSFDPELEVVVEPVRARFSAWYEMFPRSAGGGRRHGTFRDVEALLPYVADMGFDILYLPPIHPIGRTFRKGPNNTLQAGPEDPGSPWAIGAAEGGHKALHPELGTFEDFDRLVRAAAERGIHVALDIAFQAAPDHPYVTSNPEWFRRRPDGSIQYAENPPKKYQDIYPFDFETESWQELWQELASIFQFWIDRGVTVFRVDNPHTKAIPFWEWCIAHLKRRHPEVIFLSEAFTRPKVMYRLAKVGFSQSYTYFPWRNAKWELAQYQQELTQTEVREYFRPNHWPNTPDILPAYLQYGGRPAFVARLVLAATISANYGIYGPAFELVEHRAVRERSEEYLDSEKYQLRSWDLDRPDSLRDIIARVNRIRRDNPALQGDWNLRFHPTDNEELICYSKASDDKRNIVLTVVNLDPHHVHSGWVDLRLDEIGVAPNEPFQVLDMLSNERYVWTGPRQFIKLDPFQMPAHVFRVQPGRTERTFEYYF